MVEHEATPVDRLCTDGTDVDLSPWAVGPSLQRAGLSRSPAIEARVSGSLPLAQSLIRPQGIGHLIDAGSLSDAENEALPMPIRNARFLCFALCTVGQAIDERARALRKDGELIDSMILDAVAMAGLSQVSDRLARAAFDWAEERGLSASRAFSPGAGSSDWGLERQRLLFDHLPERPLGVELTDRFLMKPSKSVSFVIGIGEHVQQAEHPFSCEGCDRFDCAYRHTPGDEMVARDSG